MFEIVIFFFSESLISSFGLYWPLFFSQVAALVRFFAYYSLSPGNNHVFGLSFLFELLKGVNFGFTHMVGVQLASILCSSEVKATSQMVYNGTFVGLSSMVSGFLFGRVFRNITMDGKGVDDSVKDGIYHRFYIINIALTIAAIIAFVIKYGVVDKVLTLTPWRPTAEEEVEKEAVTSMHNKTEDKNVVRIRGGV